MQPERGDDSPTRLYVPNVARLNSLLVVIVSGCVWVRLVTNDWWIPYKSTLNIYLLIWYLLLRNEIRYSSRRSYWILKARDFVNRQILTRRHMTTRRIFLLHFVFFDQSEIESSTGSASLLPDQLIQTHAQRTQKSKIIQSFNSTNSIRLVMFVWRSALFIVCARGVLPQQWGK